MLMMVLLLVWNGLNAPLFQPAVSSLQLHSLLAAQGWLMLLMAIPENRYRHRYHEFH